MTKRKQSNRSVTHSRIIKAVKFNEETGSLTSDIIDKPNERISVNEYAEISLISKKQNAFVGYKNKEKTVSFTLRDGTAVENGVRRTYREVD